MLRFVFSNSIYSHVGFLDGPVMFPADRIVEFHACQGTNARHGSIMEWQGMGMEWHGVRGAVRTSMTTKRFSLWLLLNKACFSPKLSRNERYNVKHIQVIYIYILTIFSGLSASVRVM